MQHVSGFLTRRTLIVAAITFGMGSVIMIWLLIGPFANSTQPTIIMAAEPPIGAIEALPTEALPLEAETANPGTSAKAAEAEALIVYVSGAVIAPDVYRLPIGARIKDVIVAAGGLSADADPDAINLAAHIADAQQIKVPRRGEVAAQASGIPQATTAADGALINLNTASAAELDTLPGIGLAIAERIIEYRGTNGPFKSVDDLRNIKGIGTALFEKIAPLVTVGP